MSVLDVGTSTGTNLRMLREMGIASVTGLEMSISAIKYCESKGLGPIVLGDICEVPMRSDQFDLVLATDIIEHVEDDMRAVSEIVRLLKPGGRALFTVPMFQALWGPNDDMAGHKRRYRMTDLNRMIETSGLEIEKCYFFNYFLFLPIWAARQILKLFKAQPESENLINNKLLNKVLLRIFLIDVYLAPRLKSPFGVSALILARKNM